MIDDHGIVERIVKEIDAQIMSMAYKGLTKAQLKERLAEAEGELAELKRRETIVRADKVCRESSSVLVEAEGLVHGDRNADYGHPADNDARIAGLMRALFGWDVKPADIWQVMVLTKLSRERTRPKRDNRVDIAGYAEVGDWIARDKR